MQPLLANISIRARDKARFSFLELRMAQVLFHAGQRDGVPAPSPVFCRRKQQARFCGFSATGQSQ
jgi:hypothetical protein